ncbi:hypothetical protein LTR10_007309 [Elasticomyces elasticus]|uniref:Uncharacterized protein n=1 Tax=Elasticomyces elasticus TaxID=574655 RepID=A0AAN7WP36_9PEZI|nr:hypothetical protein LTR10_007309 [Elasticomyces elasticus]KAK4979121.1 hypothetical protein LTR42_001623 [Elasticomyces elasticus]KAK5704260.1 hypothetical protein LTR97_003275 [Elasticomyces elasticus]
MNIAGIQAEATIAGLREQIKDGANKRAAEGGETQLMVMALQSLLDVLALGLFESGEKFTAEENVKWVVYGEGVMMDGKLGLTIGYR